MLSHWLDSCDGKMWPRPSGLFCGAEPPGQIFTNTPIESAGQGCHDAPTSMQSIRTAGLREAVMKHGAIIGIAFSALALFGTVGTAYAQADCKTLVKPSPFGPDDQVGATNRITPAVTKAAAAEIQSGAVISMAYNLVDGVPLDRKSTR